MKHIAVLFALCIGLTPVAAVAAPALTGKLSNSDAALQTPQHMTLYVFDDDITGDGKSTCVKQCLQVWAPFAPNAGETASGDWTILTRDGGAKQWAYKGRPLYTYVQESGPGTSEGKSFEGNKWHVAQP